MSIMQFVAIYLAAVAGVYAAKGDAEDAMLLATLALVFLVFAHLGSEAKR